MKLNCLNLKSEQIYFFSGTISILFIWKNKTKQYWSDDEINRSFPNVRHKWKQISYNLSDLFKYEIIHNLYLYTCNRFFMENRNVCAMIPIPLRYNLVQRSHRNNLFNYTIWRQLPRITFHCYFKINYSSKSIFKNNSAMTKMGINAFANLEQIMVLVYLIQL